jgi:hypothetical protein
MTFFEARRKVISCSGTGIRRPCWKDETLRITGDKQFAGARVIQRGNEYDVINEIKKDIHCKQMNIYDGSDLYFQTDKEGLSDGGVYNGMQLKNALSGEGLPYGKEDYLAKDWEIYAK